MRGCLKSSTGGTPTSEPLEINRFSQGMLGCPGPYDLPTMSSKRRRVVWFVAAILGGCALGMVGLLGFGWALIAEPWDSRPTDDDLRAAFHEDRATFEALRRNILADPAVEEVRIDSYSWTDPCNVGACAGTIPRIGGLPPGRTEERCDGHGGCVRWVDRRPAPEILAAIGTIPVARAQSYLAGLDEVGAVAVQQVGDGVVSFWMHLQGIVPSGSSKNIVWRRSPPESLVTDTEAAVTSSHGDVYSHIDDNWYIELEWN